MSFVASLRRPVLLASGLLILLRVALGVGTAPNRDTVQVILPAWTDHIASAGLVLFVLSQGIAAATGKGWRRLTPLITLVLVLPIVFSIVLFTNLATLRREIDRVTLPGGRLVMMTNENVVTDVLFLWEPQGWRWKVFAEANNPKGSDTASFTGEPRLVLAEDGRHLLLRRGHVWTDCWTIETNPRSCLSEEDIWLRQPEEWASRSSRIAAIVGMDPS